MTGTHPAMEPTSQRVALRTPVDLAFYAVVRLTGPERAAFADRVNRHFGQCTPPLTLTFRQSPEDPA